MQSLFTEAGYGTDTLVRIGDYVSLKISKSFDGYLSAEGIISDECCVTKACDFFDDCLWEVHVHNQYNALRDYEDALAFFHHGTAETGQNQTDMLNHLQKAVVNEQRLNVKLMEMKTGKPVAFGDIIQLRHVKSKCFLTVSMISLAKQERENMRISLNPQGSAACCFAFSPRYKHDREGHKVVNNSEVLLRVQERPTEFIHVAKKSTKVSVPFMPSEQTERLEVNCSLEMTGWTVSVFQSADASPQKSISPGQLVVLQEPESSTCLCVENLNSNIVHKPNMAKVLITNQISDTALGSHVGSHMLWSIERVDFTRGGPFVPKTDRVTLRDLNTGLFMYVQNDALGLLFAVKKRDQATVFDMSIASTSSDNSNILMNGFSINLSSRGNFLCPNRVKADATVSTLSLPGAPTGVNPLNASKMCYSNPDRANALPLQLSNDAFYTVGTDLYVGVSAVKHLARFSAAARRYQLEKDDSYPLDVALKQFFKTLSTCADFLCGNNVTKLGLDASGFFQSTSSEIILMRQNLLREQGLLDVLLDMLELCTKGFLNQIKFGGNGKSGYAAFVQSAPVTNAPSRHSSVMLQQLNGDNSFSDHRRDSKTMTESQKREVAHARKVSMGGVGIGNITAAMVNVRNQSGSNLVNPPSPSSKTTMNSVSSVQKGLSNLLNLKLFQTGGDGNVPLSPPSSSDKDDEDLIEEDVGHFALDMARQSGKGQEELSLSQEVAQSCLVVLFQTLKNNHKNQMYIADRFPLLLNHVKDQEKAVDCVLEMLHDNLEMLQNKVRAREINLFVQLLVESEMSVTFLHLIQKTCSCPQGVDSTQRLVTEAMFGLASDVTIVEEEKEEGKEPAGPGSFKRQRSRSSDGLTDQSTRKMIVRNSFTNSPKIPDLRRGSLFGGSAKEASSFTRLSLMESTKVITKKQLMMKMFVDRDDVQCVEWSRNVIYIPDSTRLTDVYAHGLMLEGLPKLYVSWNMAKTGECSMWKVFGTLDRIPLTTICRVATRHGQEKKPAPLFRLNSLANRMSGAPTQRNSNPTKKINTNKTKSGNSRYQVAKSPSSSFFTTSEKQKRIFDYLQEQFYLVAVLCLDRQYVAMGILENIYEYDMLITMLKLSTIPNSLKAPVCKLIRCLYIDRDPHAAVVYPRLIRTSVSLNVQSESQDNIFKQAENQGNNPVAFALLQQVISHYIHHELDVTNCDDLSVEMMNCLYALVDFGFYSTVAQLEDILQPLAQALNDHTAMFSDNTGKVRKLRERLARPSDVTLSERNIKELNAKKKLSFMVWLRQVLHVSPSASVSPNGDGKDDLSESSYSSFRKTVKPTALTMEEEWLEIVNSWEYLISFIAVVLLSVVFAVLGVFRAYPSYLSSLDLFFASFFLCECSLRMFCHLRVGSSYDEVFSTLNTIDIAVILMDLILVLFEYIFIVFTSEIRFIRLLHIVRFSVAYRVVYKITDVELVPEYKPPIRYSGITELESKTLIGIIKVLAVVFNCIQDRKLGVCIKAFVDYMDENKRKLLRNPKEIYLTTCKEQQNTSIQVPANIDKMLTDIIMYNNDELTSEALNLLMVYCNQDRFLHSAMCNIQIVYSSKVEMKCKEFFLLLRNVKRMADMFEVWGALEEESNFVIAQEMTVALKRMTILLVKYKDARSQTIETINQSDEEAQTLLHNMSALSGFMVLQVALYDGGKKPRPEILTIWQLASKLICHYCKNCPNNQNDAFVHFDWFVARIDDNVHASKVIRSILSGNSDLIKKCPRYFIGDFARKIQANGRKCEYLDLYLGLLEPAGHGERVTPQVVRHEISKYMSSREWKDTLMLMCGSHGSEAYKQRKQLMDEYSADPASQEVSSVFDGSDLPDDLQYHIGYLRVLAGCNLGPKLQSMFTLEDVLHGMIDPSTIYIVKQALGTLLLEMVCVESVVPGIEISHYMWQFLEVVTSFFENGPTTVIPLFAGANQYNFRAQIHYIEWMKTCLEITANFFDNLDLNTFRELIAYDNDFGFEITSRHVPEIMVVISRLHNAIHDTYHRCKLIVGAAMTSYFNVAMDALKKHLFAEDLDDSFTVATGVSDIVSTSRKTSSIKINRSPISVEDMQQVLYRQQFQVFTQAINESLNGDAPSIRIFEDLPSITVNDPSDVRLEPFLGKIASHYHKQIKHGSMSRVLPVESVPTLKWLIRSWRFLLEDYLDVKIESTYNEISSLGDVIKERKTKSDDFAFNFQDVCNAQGITFLCMDLIAVGIDGDLGIEAVHLLIALLWRSGGNRSVQHCIYRYLMESESTLFFLQIKDVLEVLVAWIHQESDQNGDDVKLETNIKKKKGTVESVAAQLPRQASIMKFLQLMCEGFYSLNQNILGEQTGNSSVVNVLHQICTLLDMLSRVENRSCCILTIRVLKTVEWFLQGPCKSNQDLMVLQTELLSSLNRILRAPPPMANFSSGYRAEVERLKECAVDVLRACIEGQACNSVAVERVGTSIELNAIHLLLNQPTYTETISFAMGLHHHASDIAAGPLTNLQAKYLLFRYTLTDKDGDTSFEPSKADERVVTKVEVMSDYEVEKHYFIVPEISSYLEYDVEKLLVESMEFATHEVRLRKFVKKARKVYVEAAHQQYLRQFGIGNIANWKHILLYILFGNAMVMNLILMCFFVKRAYPTNNHHDEENHDDHARMLSGEAADIPNSFDYMSPLPLDILRILSVAQIVLTLVLLIIIILTKIPTKFRTNMERGDAMLSAFLGSVFHPIPMWYTFYLICCILGLWYNALFLSVLLLDFMVFDSTSKDVMSAIIEPIGQLFATSAMVAIWVYIFAAVMFELYYKDVVGFVDLDLFSHFKIALSYGFRGEFGVSHQMINTIGERMVFDMLFFLVVITILRGVFHAIIIEGFGKLREEKMEKEEHVNNTCFICGIDRQEYERTCELQEHGSFAHHREVTHHLMNYLHFSFRIWNQPREEDNGLESYVRHAMANDDVSWYPMGVTDHGARDINLHDADVDRTAVGFANDASAAAVKNHPTTTHGGGGHGGGSGHSSGHDTGGRRASRSSVRVAGAADGSEEHRRRSSVGVHHGDSHALIIGHLEALHHRMSTLEAKHDKRSGQLSLAQIAEDCLDDDEGWESSGNEMDDNIEDSMKDDSSPRKRDRGSGREYRNTPSANVATARAIEKINSSLEEMGKAIRGVTRRLDVREQRDRRDRMNSTSYYSTMDGDESSFQGSVDGDSESCSQKRKAKYSKVSQKLKAESNVMKKAYESSRHSSVASATSHVANDDVMSFSSTMSEITAAAEV